MSCRGYHGCTSLTIDLSEYKFGKLNRKKGFVHVISCPDYYRFGCLSANSRNSREEIIEKLNGVILAHFKGILSHLKSKKKKLAAFIMESGMSVAGVLIPKGNLLKDIQQIVHEEGAVFICDEVQTGLYRTGDHFFNFQRSGIQPDIVTLGKVWRILLLSFLIIRSC